MLNPIEMERYIHAIAARADMRVVWEKDVEIPRTDGKTIWLPHIEAGLTAEKYADIRHYVAHEVDHVRFSDFSALKGQPTCKDNIFGAIINMCEDVRVEGIGSEEYLGDRMNSGHVQSKRMGEIAAKFEDALKNVKHPHREMIEQLAPLMAWSHKHWTDMYPACASSGGAFESMTNATPTAAARYAKLQAGDYSKALEECGSTAEVLKLSERILKEVYEQDPDTQRKPEPQPQEGEGEGGDGEPQEGEGEGEGDGKEGESKPKEGKDKQDKEGKGKGKGKGEKGKDVEQTVDYSALMLDPHEVNGPTRTAQHLKYQDKDFDEGERGYSPCKLEDYTVHERGELSSVKKSQFDWYFSNMKDALHQTNPNFAHKVRVILQVRAKDRIQYGLKRGMIHQGSLHRLMVEDQPHYAERIFKRRIVSDVLDSCVFLLIDQSGSMGGEKFVHAATAAAMMNEVLGNVLHVPVFIASFTDHGRSKGNNGEQQHIHVHRKWTDQLLSNEKLLESFATAANHAMGNNADGDAIMWAYNKIATQKWKRKLIIVFSDGSPAGGYRGDCPWYTKKVVQGIEKETPVDIVGIGIEDENVKKIYKEWQVIRNSNQLETALLKTIEGKLK